MRSTLIPRRIHQSESRESRASPGDPKGLPFVGQDGPRQTVLTENTLEDPPRVSLLGRQKGIAREKVSADVIDDGERVTVLMIAEEELTFVVDRHQIVRCDCDGASPQRMCRRIASPARGHEIGTTQDIAGRARCRPLHARM